MRENRELSDVSLRVGSEVVSTHKLVLSANSPYFRAMFGSSYSEAGQSEVKMHGLTFPALEAIVKYFYTSRLHISTSNVQELLAASSMLQVGAVTDACCEFMRRHLGASNCLGVRTFADMLSCGELRRVAEDCAKRNFSSVVESEDFLRLEVEQLLELLSADDLCVESEESVFEAALKWIKHDPAQRERFLVDVLEKVGGREGGRELRREGGRKRRERERERERESYVIETIQVVPIAWHNVNYILRALPPATMPTPNLTINTSKTPK